MDQNLLKTLLSRMNKYAFESFILELFDNEMVKLFPTSKIGDGAFFRNQPYLRYGELPQELLITHYLPIELISHPEKVDLSDPILIEQLNKVREVFKGGRGNLRDPIEVDDSAPFAFFQRLQLNGAIAFLERISILTNFANINLEQYTKEIAPKYQKLVKDIVKPAPGFEGVGFGSLDTFVKADFKGTKRAFERFVYKNKDGLSISLEDDEVRVKDFNSEKVLLSGVLRSSETPCEPIYISSSKESDVLKEFESLIKKETKEAELEKFLTAHYKEIFGFKYDRIETQLWLRFPEVDIVNKNRRLDILLRNSIENDWELFEIKRVIELTSTYRDVPVLAHEVTSAIQQLRNYRDILSNEAVKAKLAKEGIEYYYPSLHLVVGKKPAIPTKQWRWLKSSNENDLKIITFDELLEEMKVRLQQRCMIKEE